MIEIYNENCMETMQRMKENGTLINVILTSPPYNTCRPVKTQKSIDTYNNRYDVHLDNMTDEEYCDWTVDLFNNFNDILADNGVILYNMSYGNENPNTMWLALSSILERTNFMIADCIVWKKKSALPNNVSHNKLTRLVEYIFVICRKNEYNTFQANKKVKSIREDTGQKYYENIFNFIEAPNNDGTCKLNKATYSSDLCLQLLQIYATEEDIVYDPFMGTGTTGIGCMKFSDKMTCIGSELSEAQCKFANERIDDFLKDNG